MKLKKNSEYCPSNDPSFHYIAEVSLGTHNRKLNNLKDVCNRFKYYEDNYDLWDSFGFVVHKINILEYHLLNFKKNEKIHLQKAKIVNKNKNINFAISYEPIDLISDFEAFLFQVKACLDILSKSVGGYFGHKPSNVKKLKRHISQYNTSLAKKILSVLTEKEWLKDFESESSLKISMRDRVSHYSVLNTSGILIDNRNLHPTTGKLKRRQVFRSKIHKKTLGNLMDEYFTQIFDLIDEVYRLIQKDICKKNKFLT